MKKTTFTFLLLFSCYHWLAAQCPDEAFFTSQAEVNDFPIQYPNCANITGSVTIFGDDITNLNGLNKLVSIGGGLLIIGNPSLTNLNGLNKLTSIGGDLLIEVNFGLTSLNGLGKLIAVGGDVRIKENPQLISLTGLEKLASTHGLTIDENLSLTNISALKSLTTINIGTGMSILNNPELTSLNGLQKLSSVAGAIIIDNNLALSSLDSLHLVAHANDVFYISGNPSLTTLNGLNNLVSVEQSFVINNNAALTSLEALGNLTAVEGAFYISGNPQLTSLEGLDDLIFVGRAGGVDLFDSTGLVISDNLTLNSLQGLESLEQIEGTLQIRGNPALTSISSLKNLTSIGGYLEILDNDSLPSLTGLDSLDYTSIDTFIIQNCPILSTCEVQPICAYLANGGAATISDNASGCNSVAEVETACVVSIEETSEGEPVILFSPNPASDFLQIQINDPEKWEINLFDLRGKLLFRQMVFGSQTIGLEDWPSGIYALRAVSGGRVFSGKIVKQ